MSIRPLVVGPAAELGQDRLTAGRLNWISGVAPSAPMRAEVKIRYKEIYYVVPADGTNTVVGCRLSPQRG